MKKIRSRILKAGDPYYRGKTVRLLSESNEQLGLKRFEEAQEIAASSGLGLIEMARNAPSGNSSPSPSDPPPVVRIMDASKFLFQETRRLRETRKIQSAQKVKEVKLHPSTDTNDFETKVRQAVEFLKNGDKVRAIMYFRGREMAHQEIGERLLQEMLDRLLEIGSLDSPAKLVGRQIIALVSPKGSRSPKESSVGGAKG